MRRKEVEKELKKSQEEIQELRDHLQELEEERLRQNRLIEKLTNHLYDLKHPSGGQFTLFRWKLSLMQRKNDEWLEHVANTYYHYHLMRRSLHQWRSQMVTSYKRTVDLQSKVGITLCLLDEEGYWNFPSSL
jgi:septal ring factor EnvC (AmiA/AmiB activator)